MNYGMNNTLLEMDTKNRTNEAASRARRNRRKAAHVSHLTAYQSPTTTLARLASLHATGMAATTVAGLIVISAIAGAVSIV